jgi:hypothetical protein
LPNFNLQRFKVLIKMGNLVPYDKQALWGSSKLALFSANQQQRDGQLGEALAEL